MLKPESETKKTAPGTAPNDTKIETLCGELYPEDESQIAKGERRQRHELCVEEGCRYIPLRSSAELTAAW